METWTVYATCLLVEIKQSSCSTLTFFDCHHHVYKSIEYSAALISRLKISHQTTTMKLFLIFILITSQTVLESEAGGESVVCGPGCIFPMSSSFDSDNICDLPSEAGPCKAAFSRWFYNSASEACEEFIYGGCEGNANNFVTLEQCLSVCSLN